MAMETRRAHDDRLKAHGASQASGVQVLFSSKMAVSLDKSLAEYIAAESNRAQTCILTFLFTHVNANL
ncbi:hypothetical protein C9417_18445 [Rhizobium sp. SEMIA 4088]|nr:hypothetical protein C9417_18445 [Rhizobium sp. SEMIA 4088]